MVFINNRTNRLDRILIADTNVNITPDSFQRNGIDKDLSITPNSLEELKRRRSLFD